MKSFIALCAGLTLCTFFYSCYNSKKAVRQTNKALFFYSDTVSGIIRNKFPCVPEYPDTEFSDERKKDKLYNDSIINLFSRVLDSIAFVNDSLTFASIENRTDSTPRPKAYWIDSVSVVLWKAAPTFLTSKILSQLKPEKVFVPYPVKDMAEINSVNKSNLQLKQHLDSVSQSLSSAKDKLNWWRIACIITWSIIAIFITYKIFKK